MDRLLFAKRKLAQIKAEISRVRTSDFHHPGVKRVLDRIEQRFDRLIRDIERVTPAARTDTLHQYNLTVNVNVDYFHRVIGIILRSTNARNSFEIYDPLLRIAKRLLGLDTVLILSSEWEFVPFSTPSIFGGVPNCTVVGLPVMEVANALVIPLAGHELGHAVWRARDFNDKIAIEREAALSKAFEARQDEFERHVGSHSDILSRLATNEWGQIPLEAMQNICEEIFCDMLGVRLFGMGYLYAFEYLAAPSLGETDLREYPSFDVRARYLVEAMSEIIDIETKCDLGLHDTSPESVGALWPGLDGYATRFSADAGRKLDDYDSFLLESAHQACETLVPRLRELATEVCNVDDQNPSPVPFPTFKFAREALDRFERGYLPWVTWQT